MFLTQSIHDSYSYPHKEAEAERDRRLPTVIVSQAPEWKSRYCHLKDLLLTTMKLSRS